MTFNQLAEILLKKEDKEFEEKILEFLKAKGYGSYKRKDPDRIEVFKIEK